MEHLFAWLSTSRASRSIPRLAPSTSKSELSRNSVLEPDFCFAASSLTVAFLGRPALTGGRDVLALVAVGAFALSIGASVYVLLPKSTFYFSLSGRYVFENLYEFRDATPEVHRRLTYDLQRFWDGNDVIMQRLFLAFRVAGRVPRNRSRSSPRRDQRYPVLDGRLPEPDAASSAAADPKSRLARDARR